jgi:uncharacterized membrane protein
MIHRVLPARSALALAFTIAASTTLAQPAERMDPDERQRLRGELRQQIHDERIRSRHERHLERRGGHPPEVWPQAAAEAAYPAIGVAPRMSPDEREQLRRQLREVRSPTRP